MALVYISAPVHQIPIPEPLSFYFPTVEKPFLALQSIQWVPWSAGWPSSGSYFVSDSSSFLYRCFMSIEWTAGHQTSVVLSLSSLDPSIPSRRIAFLRGVCPPSGCVATGWPGGSCPPQAGPHKPLLELLSQEWFSVVSPWLRELHRNKRRRGFPTTEIKCRDEESRTQRGRGLCLRVLTTCSVLSQTLSEAETLMVAYLWPSYLECLDFPLPESYTKPLSCEWRWGRQFNTQRAWKWGSPVYEKNLIALELILWTNKNVSIVF